MSDSEKAEALPNDMEAQFRPVTDPSTPPVIEMVDVTLRSYFLNPFCEPKLTTLRGSRSHQGSQVLQGSATKRYPEQGLEESCPASGITPGPEFQCHSPHSSLPSYVEARSVDLYP
jgi:hypothetical protein